MKEFLTLYPAKIDRFNYTKKSLGRIFPGSLDSLLSTDGWKKRREAMMKTIGIHYSSRYIPLMIEKFEKESNTWKVNEYFNLLQALKNITFDVMSHILYGKGIDE